MKKTNKYSPKDQHVFPLGKGWAVKATNEKRFSIITATKKDAIEYAKAFTRKYRSYLIIYDKTSQVQSRTSYAKAS